MPPRHGALPPRRSAQVARVSCVPQVPANSGGSFWTKAGTDGSTASVRLDPPMTRSPPRGFADEVVHGHKEVVPTTSVTGGNYPPSSATKLNDAGTATADPRAAHIPIVW